MRRGNNQSIVFNKNFNINFMVQVEYTIAQLTALNLDALKEIASKLNIPVNDKLDQQSLIYKILDAQAVMTDVKKELTPNDKPNKPVVKNTKKTPVVKKKTPVAKKETGNPTTDLKAGNPPVAKPSIETDVAPNVHENSNSNTNSSSSSNNGNNNKTPNNRNRFNKNNNKRNNEVAQPRTTHQKNEESNGNVTKNAQSNPNNPPQKYRNQQQDRQSGHNRNSLQTFSGLIDGEGVLDLMTEGYGFLRSSDYNYLSSPDDVHVSHTLVKKWGLLKGDFVQGSLRPPKENEKYFSMVDINRVNGCSLEELRKRIHFHNLVPLFPEKKFNLSYKPNQYAARLMEMFIPIGFGQRSLIIAQPKAGKTTILKEIANGISKNHPDVYLIVLMIGERPEEVTDMQRSVQAEVVASTFDEQHDNHIKVAMLTVEKAKRLVECGHDVVIILDSITRLARAFNTSTPSSGKVLSGGVDANALHIPKRIFGAARNIENGGSLTIIASALIDTGSRMDEVILEEFTGTGNMELLLSRNLANKGIYPAIDILRSSTRRGEDMQNPEEAKLANMLRRIMGDMKSPEEALSFLLDNMKGTATNEEFLASIRH